MTIEGTEFRRVLGHFPTGVTVITAMTGDGPAGMAIGSFASVSLDPPLVMFCPARSSTSWAQMRDADGFCVNVLGEHQQEICAQFATSDGGDKFAGVDWAAEATGAPVLEGSIAWIDCSHYAIHDGGDHEIVVGRVERLGAEQEAAAGPLLFFQGRYGRHQEL